MPRLAIIITHPIRYFVPLLQLLNKRGKVQLKVFYTYGPELLNLKKYDATYRAQHETALPLFEGYDFELVENIAPSKSTDKYSGIDNPTLISKVENWKPDVVLVCGWKFRSHLKAMRYFKGKLPVHFRGDSTLLDEPSFSFIKKWSRRLLLRWVYRHVDKAWYVGSNNKKYFERAGLQPHQLAYVPHAVDNKRFQRTIDLQAKAWAKRESLFIPGDAVVFLYAGKLNKRKGVFTLLQAFIKASASNAHLLFVGAGAEEKALKEIAAPYSSIHFLPFQTQTAMPFAYTLTDVCILPSESDTWGLVINEAMANGLAVIATDKCGGAVDLVTPEENGYIIPAGDVSKLAEHIDALSANPVLLSSMKARSREKIDQFSYHKAVEAIEEILLAGRP